MSVDARREGWRSTSTARFQKLRMGQLVPGAKLVEKSVGAIDGRAQLKGQGNSTAAVLGTANGRVDLVSGGGEVSNLLLEFGGRRHRRDRRVLGRRRQEGGAALRRRWRSTSKDGMMTSEVFVIDTDDTYFGGQGHDQPARTRRST